MLKFVLVLVVAVFLAGSVGAEPSPDATLNREPTLKYGLGVRPCAKFAEDFKNDPDVMEALYFI